MYMASMSNFEIYVRVHRRLSTFLIGKYCMIGIYYSIQIRLFTDMCLPVVIYIFFALSIFEMIEGYAENRNTSTYQTEYFFFHHHLPTYAYIASLTG